MKTDGLASFSPRARKVITAFSECFERGEPGEEFGQALLMLSGLDDEVPEILGEVMSRGNWRAKIMAAVMFLRGIKHYPAVAARLPNLVSKVDQIIVASLKDTANANAVQWACEVMGQCGEIPDAAVPHLHHLLEASDPLTAAYAATALCWLDEEGIVARRKLGQLMRSENVHAVLIAAPTMILHGDQVEVAMSLLEQALRNCGWRERCEVVKLVETIGPLAVKTLPVWKEMLADESIPSFGRALAAAAIGSVAKGSTQSVAELSAALFSEDWHIVHGAAKGLLLHGTVRLSDLNRLAALLGAESQEMRRVAILALHQFGPKAAPVLPSLIGRFGNEPDADLAKALSDAAAAIGQDAVDPLIEEIEKLDFRTMPLAAAALKGLGDKAIHSVIEKLLTHPSEAVRINGVLIMHGMGSRAAPAIPVLTEILRDTSDIEVAYAVIGTLAMCGRVAEAAVEEIIRTLIGCDDVGIEEISIHALKKIGGDSLQILNEWIPVVTDAAKDRVQRAITACQLQNTQSDKFKNFQQLDCDYLFRFYVLVGLAFRRYGKAKWGKIGKVIRPHVTFRRPNGKPIGTSPNAVRDNVNELADKLKVKPLTTHRPQVAGELSNEGERLLDQAVDYVRGKYGHEAVPEINI